jgi:hypothetical protein
MTPETLRAVVPLVLAAGILWLFRRLWYRWGRLHIAVEAADAQYQVGGLRLAQSGEVPDLGPMVHDLSSSSAKDALHLLVHVRVGVRNFGPIARTISGLVLTIGLHNGQALEEAAKGDGGDRFKKSTTAAGDGYDSIDAHFVFGSDKYGYRGGWDYSRGASYALTVTSSRKRRDRFVLYVTPPRHAEEPAAITWRRLRPWQQPSLTST